MLEISTFVLVKTIFFILTIVGIVLSTKITGFLKSERGFGIFMILVTIAISGLLFLLPEKGAPAFGTSLLGVIGGFAVIFFSVVLGTFMGMNQVCIKRSMEEENDTTA